VSDYQLWAEHSGLWWLNAALSLVWTLFLYGTFPIVFAKTRKTGITKKHYRRCCAGAAVTVYILLIIIHIVAGEEQIPNMAAALLWTTVFEQVGLSSLQKRGKIVSTMERKTTKSSKKHERVSQGSVAIAKERYVAQEVEEKTFVINKDTGEVLSEETNVRRTTVNAIRFCRHCGNELVPDSKFCSICGTKVIREW